jgi:outer membrane lipoprotein-sorting protein
MKIFSKLSLAAFLLTACFCLTTVNEARGQIDPILKKMELHQKSLSSLRGKITMEKYNFQLGERDTYEGTTIYLPAGKNQLMLRIDWTKPHQESISLVKTQYVVYQPRLNLALVGKIEDVRQDARAAEALSLLKMSKKEIKANYHITYFGQDTTKSGIKTWHLQLKPKKDASFKEIDFWVEGGGMPIQVRFFQSNNDSTTVLLSDWKKNEPISPKIFQINLPKRTKIIRSSTGDARGSSKTIKPVAAKTVKKIEKNKKSTKKQQVRKKRRS